MNRRAQLLTFGALVLLALAPLAACGGDDTPAKTLPDASTVADTSMASDTSPEADSMQADTSVADVADVSVPDSSDAASSCDACDAATDGG